MAARSNPTLKDFGTITYKNKEEYEVEVVPLKKEILLSLKTKRKEK